MGLKRQLDRTIQRIANRVMGGGLMQEENTPSGERYVAPGLPELARRCAAEGCVLLKNDGALPLALESEISVFGRCQLDWFYMGYGSGGDVHPPYRVSLIDGLDNAGAAYNEPLARRYQEWCAHPDHAAIHGWWGHWPTSHPEMPVSLDACQRAAKRSETAVVVIGRASGEDRDSTLKAGSYYLTRQEWALLDKVTTAFYKVVVVLNIGSVMDLSWIETLGGRISAVLIAWQGGMESGNAVCDVLYGKVNPCGKLADTVARNFEDYPGSFATKVYARYREDMFVGYRHFDAYARDAVLFPFGHGLSYTRFDMGLLSFSHDENGVEMSVLVINAGSRPGREVVQLWCIPPDGKLKKPVRLLAAFGKTRELGPGEQETLTLRCDARTLASYNRSLHAYVLEAGRYRFMSNGYVIEHFDLEESRVLKQCEPVCSPDVDLKARILERLPENVPFTGDMGYTLDDVAAGRVDLDAFVAQLDDRELEALSRGEGMTNSSLGPPGNAGVLGGVIPSLREKGVPPIVCADGPSGVRLRRYSALLPCATALACTWDIDLVETLYRAAGAEMRRCGVDIMLAPGLNIHRNPLGGRNFEYFSEDPLLSGRMAAAVVRGVQSAGVACCAKHLACNNQETRRATHDSRLSERALREIYLRGFEICVREGRPMAVMTAYNKVNGVWACYNYDLATTVLRREWGFDGMVMTDWWMRRARSPEFRKLRDNAYRVRAQVDVLMPGDMSRVARKYRSDGTLLATLGQRKGITLGELQRTARNVLGLILRLRFQAAEEAPDQE